MEEFFRHESQEEPPSVSIQGSLRFGTNSNILVFLKAPTGLLATPKVATVVVLDMTAVVY